MFHARRIAVVTRSKFLQRVEERERERERERESGRPWSATLGKWILQEYITLTCSATATGSKTFGSELLRKPRQKAL